MDRQVRMEGYLDIHVSYLAWDDQSIVTNQRSTRCPYSLFSIRSQRKLSSSRMSPIERPFRLAVADDENAGCCHGRREKRMLNAPTGCDEISNSDLH